jgi:hypothetical protein
MVLYTTRYYSTRALVSESPDRLCDLVVRDFTTDPEARVRFPALPKKKRWGLERGPLSLVSTTEKLLDRKVAAPV